MMDDELIPEWPMSLYDEVTTAAQQAKVAGMEAAGWTRSHLFDYVESDMSAFIGVWMISRPVKTSMSRTPAWVHCYVKSDGTIKRYKPPSAIILNEEEDQ